MPARLFFSIVVATVVASALCGCNLQHQSSSDLPDTHYPLAGKTGQHCTIEFRRDVLGVADKTPIGVEVESADGASLSETGTLVSADNAWIEIVRDDHTRLVIPTDTILLIRFDETGRPAPK